MSLILINNFLPEIFLSFCILVQLIFNIFLATEAKLNFPDTIKEAYYQTGFILLCLNFLLFNNVSLSFDVCCFSVCCFGVLIQSFKFKELKLFEYLLLLVVFSVKTILLVVTVVVVFQIYIHTEYIYYFFFLYLFSIILLYAFFKKLAL